MRAQTLVPDWLRGLFDSAVIWVTGVPPLPLSPGEDPESFPSSPRDPLDITLFI